MKSIPTLVLLAAALTACTDTAANGSGDGSAENSVPSATSATDLSPGEALAKGLDLLRKGRFEQLEAWLAGPEAALLDESRRVALQSSLLVAQDEIPKAVLLCREHLEEHPGDVLVAEALVEIYISLGADELADAVIDRTLEAVPSACRMLYQRGVLRGQQGRLREAEEALLAARECGVDGPELEYNLAVLEHQQGAFDASIERLRGLLEQDPDHFAARRELARGLLARGGEEDLAECQQWLDALSAERDDWRVWELLGLHSERIDDLQAARLYLTEALRAGENPPQTESHYLRVAQELIDRGEGEGIETRDQREDLPPISAQTQQRIEEARRKAAEAERAAAGDAGSADDADADAD